jgi:hypothetical protein
VATFALRPTRGRDFFVFLFPFFFIFFCFIFFFFFFRFGFERFFFKDERVGDGRLRCGGAVRGCGEEQRRQQEQDGE